MKKSYNPFYVLLMTLALSGCVAPYEDTRREAGQSEPVGQSGKPYLAICYHPLKSSAAEVESFAKELCARDNKKPIFKDTKYLNCTVAAPNTAFFECK